MTAPPVSSQGDSRRIDELVDAYLAEVAAGTQPRLDDFAARLMEASARSAFRLQALTAEWLYRNEQESVDLEALLAGVTDPPSATELQAAIDSALDTLEKLPPARLQIGDVLRGRYRIESEIGQGGMGIVYLAEDLELKRRVAIKALHFEQHRDWESVTENLLEESRTLASLSSPGIVTVFDVLREGNQVSLVLDAIEGLDLHRALLRVRTEAGDGPFDGADRIARLEQAVGAEPGAEAGAGAGSEGAFAAGDWFRVVARITRQLAATMAGAHAKGVLHRDLKPKNIVLRPSGEPVILDFGLAYRLGVGKGADAFRGTPEYLAPEQVANSRAGSDPRTDVYTLGLVLYELATLRPAIASRPGETMGEIFARVSRQAFDPLQVAEPRTPEVLARICAKALEADPNRRYTSMRELAEDLGRFLEGLPPIHAKTGWTRSLRLHVTAPSRRFKIGAALALFLATVLFVREILEPTVDAAISSWVQIYEEQLVHLEDEAKLANGGALGIQVSTSRDVYVYAFSVFGTGADRFYLPIHPKLTGVEGVPSEWGLRVPAGVHTVVCSSIYEDDPHAVEGLRVYIKHARDEVFEAAFDEMDIAADSATDGGLTLASVMQRLGDDGPGKGGDPSEKKYEIDGEPQQRPHYEKVFEVLR